MNIDLPRDGAGAETEVGSVAAGTLASAVFWRFKCLLQFAFEIGQLSTEQLT